jgi:hypothetical protein
MLGHTFPSEKTVCWCKSVFNVLNPGMSGKARVLELWCECSWAKRNEETRSAIKNGWNFIMMVLSKL